MIIGKTPKIFVNASRSLKSSTKTWVEPCPVSIKFEYGGKLNAGAIGCSKDGECYHLKFGGLDWTSVANFAGGTRDEANAGVFDGKFWVLGGKGRQNIYIFCVFFISWMGPSFEYMEENPHLAAS